jgi:polyisoprenoid-binding protein YceI
MISTVNGNFNEFDATMESETDDFIDAKIKFETNVSSISTNITDRDAHLRSKDFFDVEAYPKITFESTKIEKNEKNYTVIGNLTIKGISKEVTLTGEYNGNDVDAYGQTKYGFELEGTINRLDWGLTFNMAGGKGSALIGNEVKLIISVQMSK